ncbi:MAG: tRNA (adenosine(37)-N6)-threonylcarbamoyltransferase complex dimerization subunit type 1 TsaB, partial [Actinomycetes bacterium]
VTDARRHVVYGARYVAGRRVDGPRVDAPHRWSELLAGPDGTAPVRVVGEAAGRVLGTGGGGVDPCLPSAGVLAGLVARALTGSDPAGLLLPVVPLYLRRPDAQPPGAEKPVLRP